MVQALYIQNIYYKCSAYIKPDQRDNFDKIYISNGTENYNQFTTSHRNKLSGVYAWKNIYIKNVYYLKNNYK